MPELAKAYVQIIPSAEGIQGKLTKIMDGEAGSTGKRAGDKFSSAFGSVAKAGMVAVGAGLAAASAAVVKIGKEAVEGYADFEQLVGGVETLFGTGGKALNEYAQEQGLTMDEAYVAYQKLLDAQWAVQDNANKAFETAGLSANEYMETVTGFSAALISSLDGDTARAASVADQAIIDMADNANKMGSSMESIQNAYQGFAKQNYTMLDNLKLGYGGTKEEMARLLADATALSGVEYDLESYADIISAIHVIQDNLGITGTTAKEASSTISGSLSSMKAAWKNLLVGMADPNADLSGLIANVVQSAETAFGNILPVAEQALAGIASFVEQIAPMIAEKLPGLVEAVLPSILSAATTLVTALVEALPMLMQVLIDQGPVIINTLLGTILEMLPEIVTLGLTLLTSLAMGIADNLDELIPTVVDVVLQIVDTLTDPETLGNLVDASIAIIIALAEGLIEALPRLIEKAPEIISDLVQALIDNVPKLFEAAVEMIAMLLKGLADNLPLIWEKGKEIVTRLWDGITELDDKLNEKAAELMEKFGQGIKDSLSAIWEWGKSVVTEIWNGITSLDPIQWGKDMIDNFVSGIKQGWENLKAGISSIGQGIKDFLGFSEPKEGPLSDFNTYAPDMMKLFAQGIKDNAHLITDQIENSFDLSAVQLSAWETQRVNSAITGAGAYRLGSSGTSAGARSNSVVVNVYGAEGQDVRELAREVERIITRSITVKEAAWA